MKMRRMLQLVGIALCRDGFARAEYLRKKNLLGHVGENCFWQPRYIPPDGDLIRLGDNVVIAMRVMLLNHDVMHYMFRNMDHGHYRIELGAIKIGNNVFIGGGSIILPGVRIGSNVIIGAGSVVTEDLAGGGVYAGNPARRIGDFDQLKMKREKEHHEERSKRERYDEVWEAFLSAHSYEKN